MQIPELPGERRQDYLNGTRPAISVGAATDVAGSQNWGLKPAAPAGASILPPPPQQHQHQQPVLQTSLGKPDPPMAVSGAAPLQPQPLPHRDMQPLQELVGGNWLFVVFVPYFIATALQDTHLRIGLIIGTASSGLVFVVGLLTYSLNMRKAFPHILELLMPIIFVVQLGVSYHSTSYKQEVIRTYPFITHSALAGVCLASILVCYPVGYQTAQELVHKMYMKNPAVHRVGLYTTAVLTASLVTSCLLYLAPLCKGYDDQHFSALNIIFRLIYPCISTFLALLFLRFFPEVYLPNLSVVHGLNRNALNRMPAYLADALGRTPPFILDASMFQSTVDAVTKAREADNIRRAAIKAPLNAPPLLPPMTPRYSPVDSSLSGGTSPSTALAAVPSPLPYPSATTFDLATLPQGTQQLMVPEYGVGLDGRRIVGVDAPEVLKPHGELNSVYTYYAAGPPAKPPLAVYAVYGDYAALQPKAAQPPQYGGSTGLTSYSKVTSAGYGGMQRPPNMYGRGGGDDEEKYLPQPVYPIEPPYRTPPNSRLIPLSAAGRRQEYSSPAGEGPYGANIPLYGLEAEVAGPLPPLGQPDAVVTGITAPGFGHYHQPGLAAGRRDLDAYYQEPFPGSMTEYNS